MYTIGVDDGHGLETAGKRTPDGYKENEFNHYTKTYLIEELLRCGFKVVDCSPTREDNSLQNRCDRANNGKCDVFISIHFNAMGNTWQTKAEGLETYYHYTSSKGKALATTVHNYLIKGTSMINRGVFPDSRIYTHGFAVLRNTKMPAILCECGFMDNKRDAALMKSTEYRKECAREIAQGLCEYTDKTYIPAKSYKTANEILDECSKWSSAWKAFIIKLKSDSKYKDTAKNIDGLIRQVYYHKKTL